METQIDQAAIDNFKAQLTSLKFSQENVLMNIERLKQEKADHKQIFDETKKLKENLQIHTKTLEDHHNHSLTIENFMEKYVPITIQTQISDTLKSILDKKMRKHLDNYEISKVNLNFRI